MVLFTCGTIPNVREGGRWGGIGKLKLLFNGDVIWLDEEDILSGLDWRLVDELILPFNKSVVSETQEGKELHYIQ
jgi:hypothetical protein